MLPADTLYLTIKILGETERKILLSGSDSALIEKIVQAFGGK